MEGRPLAPFAAAPRPPELPRPPGAAGVAPLLALTAGALVAADASVEVGFAGAGVAAAVAGAGGARAAFSSDAESIFKSHSGLGAPAATATSRETLAKPSISTLIVQ